MTDEVQLWLDNIGLSQYLNNFLENGYDDIDSLWDLNHDDLDAIGVILPGHRKKILHHAAKFSSDTQGDWENQSSHEEVAGLVLPVSQPVAQPEEGEDLNDAIWKLGTLLGELSEFTDGDLADGAPPENQQILRAKSPRPIGSPAVRSSVYTTDTLQESTQQGEDIDLDDLLDDLYSFNPAEELQKIEFNKGRVQRQAPSLNYIPPPISSAKSYPSEQESNLHPLSQTVLSPRKSTSMEFPEVSEPISDQTEFHPTFLSRSKTLCQPATPNTDPTKILATPKHLQPEQVKSRLEELNKDLQLDSSLSIAEREQRLKEEKIKIALEKMKVASKQKIVIKAFNEDMSSKTVVVDDDMQSWYVSQTLIMKNHSSDSPNWGLIEFLPEFSLQRMLEDHEIVIDAYQAWPRETQNMFIFKNDEYKYDLFHRPYEYFPAELCLSSEQAKNTKDARTERARKMLINEYFSDQGRIPELEGLLFIKDGRKPWKRLFVLLRGSGIYYSNRGKSKQSKHLVSFCSIHDYDIYVANNYRKIYSAPKNYCFVLKPQGRHLNVGWGDLKCFCAPNKRLMFSWIAGLRLVKHGGPQLKDNFVSMQNKEYKLAQIERDDYVQGSSPPHQPNPSAQLNRQSSAPASASMEVKQPLSHSTSEPREHSPSVPIPYSMSPTETQPPEQPFIPSQHPGALHLPPPSSQHPIRPQAHTLPHQQTAPGTLNPVPVLQPPVPVVQQRPLGPKLAKKPLFIPRSEQDSKYAPRPTLPQIPQVNISSFGNLPSIPPVQQLTQLPTPYVPEKRKKPVPQLVPCMQPQRPIQQQIPTSQPSIPVQPVVSPPKPQPVVSPPKPQPVVSPPKPQPTFSPPKPQSHQVAHTFQDKSWFHGPISRDEAARRIASIGSTDGIYLIRESTTYKGSYVLTMVSQGQLRNFQIQTHGARGSPLYGIDDGPRFISVDELIQHYSSFDDRLPCKLAQLCIKHNFSTHV